MTAVTPSSETFGRVAVLMGGSSAEREISLQSGAAVLQALLDSGVDAVSIDTQHTQALLEALKTQQVDRVFNALHGRGGEDGVVQGFLELMGIPCTGSGVLGSALSMDKYKTKQIWMASGLPTPDCVLIESRDDLDVVTNTIGFPCIIKPVHEGSSIGISKVDSSDGLDKAWENAHGHDQMLIAEEWIVGQEYTAAILGRESLPLIRLQTPHTFYDYEAKYQSESTQYHCPCGLEAPLEEKLKGLCLQAFDALDTTGWGRVDFMLDDSEQPWLIEVNTVPGMTHHSLVPMAAKQAGIGMNELVWKILETSVRGESS
ncbi:MAG: D-alanine--D-alanine ligase [Gammaproteobacteria bacterium]